MAFGTHPVMIHSPGEERLCLKIAKQLSPRLLVMFLELEI